MKKMTILFLIAILFISCNDDWYKDKPNIIQEKHGMQAGTDSIEIGGKIFYVDSVNGFCLVALISEETQFQQDCQYPTWCPYTKKDNKEYFIFINNLVDTIGGGKINTQRIFNEYGCNFHPDYYNNGFYGALCAYDFESLYDDYWAANLREVMLYANNVGSSDWYATTTQVDTNNYYTYNCRDKRLIIEPKSQKRLPLVIRKHKFE